MNFFLRLGRRSSELCVWVELERYDEGSRFWFVNDDGDDDD